MRAAIADASGNVRAEQRGRSRQSVRRPLARAGLSVGIVLAAAALGGCAGAVPGATTATGAGSAANRLADAQAGRHLAGSDPLVRAIARHLASLDRKCRGSEAQVAGYIDFAAADLAKYGIHQTRSSLAAQLDENIQGFPANFDCQGFVAAYLVLRESR